VTARLAAPALLVEDVTSGYRDLAVLRGLSLTVAEGALELVLGRNGVGKTTLLSTIAGLIPASKGKIICHGQDLGRQPAYRRAGAGVALVQQGKRVFHNLSLLQNVALGARRVRMPRRDRQRYCRELLSQFPALQGRERERAGALSGGQQQMLAIAQALAARPRVLMLDEPSAGLSPAVVADVLERVAALRDGGMTVLLVEQLADQALPIADHVSVINDGRIVASGLPQQFADSAALHQAYFGTRAVVPAGAAADAMAPQQSELASGELNNIDSSAG
jgi:branched-chain amino acid transport system ATP-binding protein